MMTVRHVNIDCKKAVLYSRLEYRGMVQTGKLLVYRCYLKLQYFPGSSDGKVSVYKVGDPGSVPGLGGSPGEGNGNPLQYSCLENSMDRGAW